MSSKMEAALESKAAAFRAHAKVAWGQEVQVARPETLAALQVPCRQWDDDLGVELQRDGTTWDGVLLE
jgi:hypothetical protein